MWRPIRIVAAAVVQAAVQGPWVLGVECAGYAIGLKGCGDPKTFVVLCPEGGSGCYAAGLGPFHRY